MKKMNTKTAVFMLAALVLWTSGVLAYRYSQDVQVLALTSDSLDTVNALEETTVESTENITTNTGGSRTDSLADSGDETISTEEQSTANIDTQNDASESLRKVSDPIVKADDATEETANTVEKETLESLRALIEEAERKTDQLEQDLTLVENTQDFLQDERRSIEESSDRLMGERIPEKEDVLEYKQSVSDTFDELEGKIEKEEGVELSDEFEAKKTLEKENVIHLIEDYERTLDYQREQLIHRGGQEMYQDTDDDGISDYDEKNIYFTNPQDAGIDENGLDEGDRLLDRLNPETGDAFQIDEPSKADVILAGAYELTSVQVVKANMATSTEISKEESTQIIFKGQALPNSFVTLYIYSMPIVVTVKADESGNWSYTLDKELENGEHEVYLATVNNAGKIVARSEAIPFVKTAEAVEITPPQSADVAQKSGLPLKEFLIPAVAIFVLLLIAVITLIGFASRKSVQ